MDDTPDFSDGHSCTGPCSILYLSMRRAYLMDDTPDFSDGHSWVKNIFSVLVKSEEHPSSRLQESGITFDSILKSSLNELSLRQSASEVFNEKINPLSYDCVKLNFNDSITGLSQKSI
jgi:hypothetical protein